MIDHVTIFVGDLDKSKAYYEKSLEPLGYKLSFGKEDIFWAFDIGNKCLFEIAQYKGDSPLITTHIAFRATRREQVEAFHKSSILAGGKCNGAPGLRPQYTKNYYAAFVHDPDGHNIEAMYYV